LSQWTDPADTENNVAWARGLYDALQPHASGAFLLNFLDQEDDAIIRASFGPNYDRLAELKRKYDPENFFRQNHNVYPDSPRTRESSGFPAANRFFAVS
jgi:FAD/FMN-containing dehydrogenase